MISRADSDEYEDSLMFSKKCSAEELAAEISSRVNVAFNVALAKLVESGGSIERVIQTGEAFGRGLFAEFISEKPEQWTMQEWITATINNIFGSMDDFFSVENLNESEAHSVLNQSVLFDNPEEQSVAALFTYSFLRGMLLSAFPKGEILFKSMMSSERPVLEFTFKANASYLERFERSRVKDLFISTKKLEL
ncbi:MAG: hypothetical protein R6V50_01310 [Thermoplasmatota archaeon]